MENSRDNSPLRGDLLACAIAVLLTAGLLASLEVLDPYFFLYDDNATFFLASYVHNYETLRDAGELAVWNSHQYLGYPHLASGQTAVLYPPVYFAAFLSDVVLGDLRGTVDILVGLHFLLAAAGIFFLARRLGLHRVWAVTCALVWVSFPYTLIVARSWGFISFAAAFVPWNVYLLLRWIEAPTCLRRILLLAGVKGLYTISGYVQYMFLATLIEGGILAAIWLFARERRSWAHPLGLAGVFAITAALSSPMVFPMLEAKNVSKFRSTVLERDEIVELAVEPLSFLSAQAFRFEPGVIFGSGSALFYLGIGLLVPLVFTLVPRRRAADEASRRWPLRILAIATIATFVFSTEAYGWLYGLPVLSSFRWPFKSMFFVGFLATLVAFLVYARWFERGGRIRSIAIAGAFVALASNLAVIFDRELRRPFSDYCMSGDVSAFRASPSLASADLEHFRVATLAETTTRPDEISSRLGFNFATLHGSMQIGGYDPLVPEVNHELAGGLYYRSELAKIPSEETSRYLGTWAVRYFLADNTPLLTSHLDAQKHLSRLSSDESVVVYENRVVVPLVFLENSNGIQALPFRWIANGIEVDTGDSPGRVWVGLAGIPGYRATSVANRDEVELSTHTNRLFLDTRGDRGVVTIRYVDSAFQKGLAVLAATTLVFALLFTTRRLRKLRARARAASIESVLPPPNTEDRLAEPVT